MWVLLQYISGSIQRNTVMSLNSNLAIGLIKFSLAQYSAAGTLPV